MPTRYPARFTLDPPGYLITFRYVPEAITQGETLDEALEGEELIVARLWERPDSLDPRY